ncbi:Macrophage erythroblast attacher isoform 1 [Rhodotorula toruloides ATCC 204091]|uniref:BY PROTMAP: gi/342321578/gb/EGU13511.1/ Macrophage erythroblast attacher isoform 1 [Rhodotorula glutinis ATCC 204091] n=2 Tax=Rhodotorula toruloides TaxID=5286 RepID=A0A0K3CIZ2_RHOTO|nr:Macrophage erythroblast attacher isoform 1 [Rhodotorula toruloides ATCC 204091]
MSSSNKLVPEQVLLLEQATLKAPLDNLRRLQKQTQKTYEHNLNPSSTFQKDLDALLRSAASSSASLDPSTQAEMLKSVDSMLARMRTLKRKLGDLKGQNDKAVRVVQSRLDHLAALPESMDSPAYGPWARKRLAHQLVDYFLRSTPPLKESARELAREEGIEELVDTEVWDELGRVEKGLEEERLDEVLAWVGENRTALKKLKSPLEFTIHLQAYIELCRARDAVSAIAYARKHLSPATAAELETSGSSGDESAEGAGKGSLMGELSRAMALLAYPPDTTCRVYQDLYSPSRWSTLRSLFRTTFLTLHSLPSIPLLHMSLQAGIASLKTPICCPVPSGTKTAPPSAWPLGGVKGLRTSITPEGEIVFSTPGGTETPSPSNGATQPPVHTLEGSPSPNCPLCSSPLSQLGPDVPYSHHVNSTIVCGITGKVVEGDGGEGGQLVALVSRVTGEGRVYSKETRTPAPTYTSRTMTAPQDHPYGFSPSAASAEFDDQFDPLQFDDDEYALDGDDADDCFGALGGSFATSASASSVASSQAGGGGGVGSKKARANNRKGPHNADKRATHNAVERKRRESLNTRFLDLAKALPTMQHIKRPSKAVIVTKALDYVYDSLLRERALVEENNQLRVEVDALRAKLGLPSLPPPKPLPECRPATQSTLRRSKKVLMAGSARKEEPVPVAAAVAVKQEPASTSASGNLPTPPTASPSTPPIPSPASYAPALSASPSAASIPFDSTQTTQTTHQAPTFPPSLFANTAVPTSAADLTSPLDAAAMYAATGHSIHSPVSAPAVMNQSNPFFVGPAHPPAPPPALHGLYAPHAQAQMMPPQYQLFFALQQQQQAQAQAQAQAWNIHQQQFAASAWGAGADSPTNTSVSSSSPASSTMFASAVPASFAVDGLAF